MNLLQRLRSLTDPTVSLQKLTTSSTAPIIQPVVSTPTSTLRTLKLIMVTAENNNKYYEMRENDNATFTVRYGRVGGTHSTATYPVAQWDKKFREKVAKGYVDQTHLYADKSTETDASTIADPDVRSFMGRLLELARQSIYQNYVVTAQQVTRKQVETAQQLLNKLADLAATGVDLNAYNATLLELFKTIPRKMGKVSEHLLTASPQTTNDLQGLRDQLAGEQETLDVMRGQVELTQSEPEANQPAPTLLEVMNLNVAPVTDKRVLTLIKRMMGPDADKFDAAFSIQHTATQASFDTYVSQRPNQKTQLLWHGSRSENWMSILKTGLVLRPASAIITGKMFGYGIYFADQFSKSLNYTSLHGSTWARGRQQEGYLAIYEVHVGKQLTLTKHENWHMQLDSQKLNNIDIQYDSVFAQRGMSLQKNEFIVYNPAQCTIRYMVKIKI
ncbi:WGR domain-containing protein [Spirosoma sp.]|uniref:WGR domain-containing protein n=1 Tax=Spirosoma sp. TaxID=1899569 RepID=UPI003B3AB468